MKTRFLLTVTGAGLGVLVANDAHAAGFALDVQSARATGMAASMTAMVDDSSAIFFNPAGMARGPGLDAQVGITPIVASFSFTDPGGNKSNLPFRIVPPFNGYVSYGVTDDLTVGIGAFAPYGLVVQWDPDWEGRNIVTKTSLITYDINPSVAYRFGPVRLGAGFSIIRQTVELQRQIRFPGQEGSTQLGAGAWTVAANGGVQVDAIKKYLTVGAAYRSAFKSHFDGLAHFENVPAAFQSTVHDQSATTSLVNPDNLSIGVATQPIDALIIDADITWYLWSRFKSINIDFPNVCLLALEIEFVHMVLL